MSTKRKAIPTIGKKNNKSSKSISCLPRPLLWGPLTLPGVAAVVAGILMAREIEPLTSQEVEKTREMSTLLGDERFLFRPADAAPAPERSLPRQNAVGPTIFPDAALNRAFCRTLFLAEYTATGVCQIVPQFALQCACSTAPYNGWGRDRLMRRRARQLH